MWYNFGGAYTTLLPPLFQKVKYFLIFLCKFYIYFTLSFFPKQRDRDKCSIWLLNMLKGTRGAGTLRPLVNWTIWGFFLDKVAWPRSIYFFPEPPIILDKLKKIWYNIKKRHFFTARILCQPHFAITKRSLLRVYRKQILPNVNQSA